MNLYNKYRPFQLVDLVGQKPFVDTLLASAKQGKFAQSYVLGGTKGTGKTSSARIVATLMNCSALSNGVLCGECRACKTIRWGSSQDVIELDGGQKRSVEDIAPILESLAYPPQELKSKIIIIDEAHLLSSTAITSLLKIVEEPPSFASFVFCTTEMDKIPDTILSRSFRFSFKKILNEDIVERLELISKKENIKIEKEALFILSRISNGAMRDSISLLEQVVMSAQGIDIITKEYVSNYYNVFSNEGLYTLISEMINQNYASVLNSINGIYSAGLNLRSFLYEISEVFRGIMLIKVCKSKIELTNFSEEEISKMKDFSEKMKYTQLDSISKIFASIHKEIDYNINPKWVLDSAIIKAMTFLRKEQ